jgi:putative DNA primase/helicase
MTPAEILVNSLGGRWRGSYGEARCPAHEDRHPSLSVRDGHRSVLLKCHAGCSGEKIVGALRRDGLWSDATQRRGPRDSRTRSDEDTRVYLRLIWRRCRPIAGTPAERYLRNRGIRAGVPESLRYHAGLRHTPTGLMLPAMVAAVQGPDRSIIGLHRTFLRADGACKAPVSHPRMMLGTVHGGAVRLAAVGVELAIGEGIETCLSFQQVTGIATWAALSTTGLRGIVLPPLPLAATVHILVDLDTAGEDAAQHAAHRLHREGRAIKLHRPLAGKDCNDAMQVAARHA